VWEKVDTLKLGENVQGSGKTVSLMERNKLVPRNGGDAEQRDWEKAKITLHTLPLQLGPCALMSTILCSWRDTLVPKGRDSGGRILGLKKEC